MYRSTAPGNQHATMLPSMPLISTPFKDDSRSSGAGEGKAQDDEDGESSGAPRPAAGVGASPKRSSPLKHVTPILKKYSCQRKVRGGKSLAGSPEQVVEKPGLRPIAPKPVVVMITSQPLAQERNDLSIPACGTKQAAAVDSSSVASSVVAVEQAKRNEAGAVTEESNKAEEVSKRETLKDNEEDIAALMHSATNVSASPRSRPALSRKKTKQLKDMEATLSILTDVEDPATKEEKAFSFAHSYFMKVKERLEGREEEVYQQFLRMMNEFSQLGFSVVELYRRVTSLLGHHGDLASEFLAFLLPDQALQCGKFMEHLMVTKMRDFFRNLEGFFAKQPHHMKKIYSSLSVLSNQTNVTIGDVQSTILPLLKGNTFLTHSFLELLPQECPPDSLMTEFEFVQCYDESESEEELFEVVEVPDRLDPYGGNNCCCPCHDSTNDKYRSRVLHCIPCGTKFIHGRVFVESGKGLRHAKIIFTGSDGKANIERLTAAKVLQRKGRRRRRTCGHIKKNRSPSKQASTAAKPASTEDNSTENTNVQATSKISSPTSARSKTRTTNVSQKARETRASAVTASSAASPPEKKEHKNSPSKLGRQVATVRLCRVPSTACSYAIVPSSKNTTKTTMPLSETKSKAPVKSSYNEAVTTTVTSSTVVKPNADQQKQQHPRQRKSVDSSACVSNDVSTSSVNTSKSHRSDCNLQMASNTALPNELEQACGHRRKRIANDVEAEAPKIHDCMQVCKAAKHFHGQVATQANVTQCGGYITATDQENSNRSETRKDYLANVCETVETSAGNNSQSNWEKINENEVDKIINATNCEENKLNEAINVHNCDDNKIDEVINVHSCEENEVNEAINVNNYEENEVIDETVDVNNCEENEVIDETVDVNNCEETEVNDETVDVNNYEETEVNDETVDVNNYEETEVNDETVDVNNYEETEVNDETVDVNNYEENEVNDETDDVNNCEETEVVESLNVCNTEETESDNVELVSVNNDEVKHGDDVMSVEEGIRTRVDITLDKSEENKSQYIEQLVKVVSSGVKHEEDLENVEKVVLSKDSPKGDESREMCKNAVDLDENMEHRSESRYPDPLELVMVTHKYECEEESYQGQEDEVLELNCSYKCEEDVEMFNEGEVVGTTTAHKSEVNNMSDDSHISKVSQTFQEEKLSDVYKYKDVDFMEVEDAQDDDKDKHDDESETLEVREAVETNIEYDYEKGAQNGQESEETISDHTCQEVTEMMDVSEGYKHEEDIEESKEINVTEFSIEENNEEIDITEVNIEGKSEEIDVTEVNIEGKSEEIDVTEFNIEGKSEEIDVAEVNIEGKSEEIDVTEFNIEGKSEEIDVADNVEKYEEMDVTEFSIEENNEEIDITEVSIEEKNEEIYITEVNVKENCEETDVSETSVKENCNENELSLVNMSNKCKCEVSAEKTEVLEINSVQICREEMVLTTCDEFRCEDDASKCEEMDVVEMSIEPKCNNELPADMNENEKYVQACEEVPLVRLYSGQKCDDEVSLANTNDDYRCEDEVEKYEVETVESNHMRNEENRAQRDGSDDSKCPDNPGKNEEREVVELSCEQNSEDDMKPLPWTRDEDKIILETFQNCSSMDRAFVSISRQLPSRTIQKIRTRFQTLMNLLEQLTGSSVNEDAGSSCT